MAQVPLHGSVLFHTARIIGARVTSFTRTPEENDEVGGLPNSKHLTSEAIDVGAEANQFQVSVLKLIASKSVYDKGGTAPHWHFEADQYTTAKAAALGYATFSLIRNLGR